MFDCAPRLNVNKMTLTGIQRKTNRLVMEHKVPSKRNQSENRKNCKIIPFLWSRHFIMLLLSFLCAFVFSACEEKEDAIPPYVEMDQHTLDVMNYSRNFRRDWDEAQDVVAERLAQALDEYGADDPRYKDFDVARAAMEYMYNPIRNRREHHVEDYNKARKSLERSLALAEKDGNQWDVASLKGQLAELGRQHAKNTEEYKREKQMFLSMFGSRKKVDKYDATVVILAALEKKLCHLQMVEAMIQHENSGFFNKWLKPWNWGVSMSSMDSKWEQSSVILRSQINQLNEALDEILLIRREMEEDGFTRSRALSIIKGK